MLDARCVYCSNVNFNGQNKALFWPMKLMPKHPMCLNTFTSIKHFLLPKRCCHEKRHLMAAWGAHEALTHFRCGFGFLTPSMHQWNLDMRLNRAHFCWVSYKKNNWRRVFETRHQRCSIWKHTASAKLYISQWEPIHVSPGRCNALMRPGNLFIMNGLPKYGNSCCGTVATFATVTVHCGTIQTALWRRL